LTDRPGTEAVQAASPSLVAIEQRLRIIGERLAEVDAYNARTLGKSVRPIGEQELVPAVIASFDLSDPGQVDPGQAADGRARWWAMDLDHARYGARLNSAARKLAAERDELRQQSVTLKLQRINSVIDRVASQGWPRIEVATYESITARWWPTGDVLGPGEAAWCQQLSPDRVSNELVDRLWLQAEHGMLVATPTEPPPTDDIARYFSQFRREPPESWPESTFWPSDHAFVKWVEQIVVKAGQPQTPFTLDWLIGVAADQNPPISESTIKRAFQRARIRPSKLLRDAPREHARRESHDAA
jgi:hypothetical protein